MLGQLHSLTKQKHFVLSRNGRLNRYNHYKTNLYIKQIYLYIVEHCKFESFLEESSLGRKTSIVSDWAYYEV